MDNLATRMRWMWLLALIDAVTVTLAEDTLDETSCFKSNTLYSPVNMGGQSRTVESNAAACQSRCGSVRGCAYFSFWPNGGCHLQSSASEARKASGVTAGPKACSGLAPPPPPPAQGSALSTSLTIPRSYNLQDIQTSHSLLKALHARVKPSLAHQQSPWIPCGETIVGPS